MGIFGWSYPPGAATDPHAPYNQTDEQDNSLVELTFPEHNSLSDVYAWACGIAGRPVHMLVDLVWHETTDNPDGYPTVNTVYKSYGPSEFASLGTWDHMASKGQLIQQIAVEHKVLQCQWDHIESELDEDAEQALRRQFVVALKS